jgi:hypothetical protein
MHLDFARRGTRRKYPEAGCRAIQIGEQRVYNGIRAMLPSESASKRFDISTQIVLKRMAASH